MAPDAWRHGLPRWRRIGWMWVPNGPWASMTTDTMTRQAGNSDTGLFRRIFPGQIDNNFRGRRLAIWLFGFYVLANLGEGAASAFNSYSTAMTADGIPLDSYSATVAQTIVSMFALLGVRALVISLLCAIAVVRYRAMIPLLYLVLLVQNISGRLVLSVHPIARSAGVQPIGFYVNLVLLAILILGFALSLAKSPAQT
jgi:hypothetical protein